MYTVVHHSAQHGFYPHVLCGKCYFFLSHDALASIPTMHVTTTFVADWLNSVLQTWSLFQLAKHTQLHAERHN